MNQKEKIDLILENQRAMMIRMSKRKYYEGYFAKNIEKVEEALITQSNEKDIEEGGLPGR